MTPLAQELDVDKSDDKPHGDSVVISGVSTALPSCENLLEFADKLYKKEEIVSDKRPRWKNINHAEVTKYLGKVAANVNRFDAQYFIIHHALAHSVDVASKQLLEHSIQAIFDAGISPAELWGQRVGVFISSGILENERLVFFKAPDYGILGCNRTMFANRISYCLNLKGPSISIDASCCGSICALENAVEAIRTGLCDSAIVGSSRFLMHPQTAVLHNRVVPLSPDGKTKSYDSGANGYLASEAVNVIYLQKCRDAKRIYAEVCHVKCEFDVPEDFGIKQGPYRTTEILTRFLGDFYKEACLSPSAVEYVDGFGAAIPEIDKMELEAMDQVFCKHRKHPLLVGSVMSNIGYTESTSGLCGIIKLLVAYKKGELPANSHYENPREDIAAIREGRIQILADNHNFQRSYAAVNSFSLTGLNGHALLKGIYKEKVLSKYKSNLPYLVVASGRMESSVKKILDDVKGRPIDPEEIALLHNIFKLRISKHLARGFGIYSFKDDKVVITHRERVDYYNEVRRPLWFVYSGMGSQWAGMGTDLMRIPVFAAAIHRCHKVLETKGLNLIDIITTNDETVFDNILNCFVGIAAIQIGLTDILREVGLVPDNIIGHSVGELGCAYADGCFTAEEMILMAYNRGLVSLETEFIKGSMAAVGLGYKKITNMCPPEIDVACHNGPNSCTISGPADVICEFTKTLKARGIFAKEVKCSNIAYHSRYIAKAGPKLLNKTREVIRSPKLRSERWISTSVPQNKWNEPAAKYSSAEYHTNNLLNPVLFEEMLRFIPSNAVTVEVAPHGLLQAILKRSLSPDCQHIHLTRRGDMENVLNVLDGIGRLYMEGCDVDISRLYPKVEFPVSTATRPLSHMVEWSHTEEWSLCNYICPDRYYQAIYTQNISILDDDFSYLSGHVIQGKRVYPFAGALISAWELLAMTMNKKYQDVSVIFQNVIFHTQPLLHKHRPINVSVSLQRGCGKFEVTYEHGIIADGYIIAVKTTGIQKDFDNEDKINLLLELNDDGIYKLFNERGYNYCDKFRSIKCSNLSIDRALVKWNNNWTTFLDGIFQMYALRCPHDSITQPDFIRRIVIDSNKHINTVKDCLKNDGVMDVTYDMFSDTTRCGGLVIETVRCNNKPAVINKSVSLKSLKFVPFFQSESYDIITTLYVYLQIIAENTNRNKITIFYVSNGKQCIIDKIGDLLKNPPVIELNTVFITKEDLHSSTMIAEKPDVVFMDDLLLNKEIFEVLYHSLPQNTFLLSIGIDTTGMYPSSLYQVLCAAGKRQDKIELARWRPISSHSSTTALTVKSRSDIRQLETAQRKLTRHQKLLIVAPSSPDFGLKDLVKKWREKEENKNIALVTMDNKNFKEQELARLSALNLAFNAFHNGTWGGEYLIPMTMNNLPSTVNCTLKVLQPGDLNSLTWVQVPDKHVKGIKIQVHYAALNTNDIRRANAEVFVDTNDSGFGMDFSGVTERGERVMGLVKTGAASRVVYAHPKLLWPVPEHWSLEDAATVPLAYAHAFYCLVIKSDLHPGYSVLIHGGSGALGQAAISIALAFGCEVFTTVSDMKKKHFLRKLFPDLKDDHIGNSRDTSFRDMVMSLTKGVGCNIIVSCVRGHIKEVSLRCLSRLGTFIDTEQLTSHEKFNFGMAHLPYRAIKIIDVSSMLDNANQAEIEKLQIYISEGIARGYVRPLSRITYSPDEVPRAFRLLSASRHRGRVLLRLQDIPKTQPRLICNPDKYQFIVSNTEESAAQIADLLIRRGARKIYLNCANPTAYITYKKYIWQNLGVQIHVLSDYIPKNKLQVLPKECADLENIFVVTTNINDDKESEGILSYLVNLDNQSRELCPNLRNFVCISDDLIGQDVIIKRSQRGLPSLMLKLHGTKQAFESDPVINESKYEDVLALRPVLNNIEKAINSKDTIVYICTCPLPQLSMMEECAKIIGDSLTDDLDSTRLHEIGIDYSKFKELSIALNCKFNINISPESFPNMKIGELKNLQEKFVDVKKDIEGFSAYFSVMDKDELNATIDIFLMPTLIHAVGTRSDEMDADLDYLCIVPGLEGHYGRFNLLCERLKMAAVVLQPGIDNTNETIPEMATRLVNNIIQKLSDKDHYYLVGFEFGTIIVLEMASVLEKLGRTCTLFLLGGTPKDIQQSIKNCLKNTNNGKWDEALVNHMYSLISGEESSQLKRMLKDTNSWQEKVDICMRILRPRIKYSTQYITKQIEVAYRRIELMLQWKMQLKPLNSKIIILRAVLPTPLDDLKVYSTQDVVVYNLEASLPYAPRDLRCPAIINKFLSPKILEAYNNKNHCESALVHNIIIELSVEKD